MVSFSEDHKKLLLAKDIADCLKFPDDYDGDDFIHVEEKLDDVDDHGMSTTNVVIAYIKEEQTRYYASYFTDHPQAGQDWGTESGGIVMFHRVYPHRKTITEWRNKPAKP